MKKILITLICVAAVMLLGTSAALADSMLLEYDGDIHEYDGAVYALVVNNHEIDPPLSPIIFNDRALVPVREIFEEVGATVEYNTDEQSVRIYNEDTTVLLYINDNIAFINGRKVAIPDNVVPKLISKLGGETKTMVPVRFISESIGMPVDFDAEAGAILIASDNYDYSAFEPVEQTSPKAYVTDISYNVSADNELTISIAADNPIENIDYFTMSSPGRLVIDLNGAGLGISDNARNVNQIGINAIRLGDNGERARIVIDSEYISSYYVEKLSDTHINAVIMTDAPLEEAPVQTPIPVSRPSATKAPVNQDSNTNYIPASNSTKLIVLDAGHGGTDSGAVGELNGEQVLEKNLTLSITWKVKEILEKNGLTVSMTRTGDTLPSLVERPTQANGENAALFVSIHINSADPESANGIETYYSLENNGDTYGITSQTLAAALLKHTLAETGAVSRGVRTANHAVTKRCNMPASLVECGFISNDNEVYLMSTDEYQNKLAKGIADGILEVFNMVTIPD